MPEMSGIETIRQIRKIIGDDSAIILMSAYDRADIEHEARQAGVLHLFQGVLLVFLRIKYTRRFFMIWSLRCFRIALSCF